MNSLTTLLSLATLLCLPLGAVAQHSCNHTHQHGEHEHATEAEPLKFIENKGQWHSNIEYKVNFPGGALFLENNTFTYCFMHPDDHAQLHDINHLSADEKLNTLLRYHAYKVQFLNAGTPSLHPQHAYSAYFNYFIGNDPSKWASNVALYEGVNYQSLYPGIGLVAKNDEGKFKYDLLVDPQADLQQVQLNYEGVDGLSLREGALVINTSVGEIVEARPFSYQEIDGDLVEVEVQYVLSGTTVGFEVVGNYDPNYALVVDPTVIASTMSGTNGSDNYGHAATFDDNGNIYTGAISFGVGYPTTTGAFQMTYNGTGWGTDIALSKLSPDGTTLIYATYCGGDEGEYPHSLFVSNAGELTVYGSSNSPNYPVSGTAYDNTLGTTTATSNDIVVTKLNPTGTGIVGSTFVGGDQIDGNNWIATNYGDTYRGEIILDAAGNIYIASFSQSTDFPVTGGAFQATNAGGQDAVFFKLNPDCSSLLWSTYLGSTGDDAGYGLREDGAGGVFVTGAAGGANFPTTGGVVTPTFIGGSHDGFVAHLNNNGSALLASTFIGSTDKDESFFLDVDQDGDVYVFGQNAGPMTLVPASVYGTANSAQFIAKFDPSLSTLHFSTNIGTGTATGGGGWPTFDMVPIAFMVDQCGYIYASGHNSYTTMPTTAGALYTMGGFYLMVLEPDAVALEYATFYEGANHVDGGTSRFDPSGVVYQAVCTAGVFPTTPGAWDNTQPNSWDVGVFKIDFQIVDIEAEATANPSVTGCAPFTVDFSNQSVGTDYIWDFADGSPTDTAFEPSHTFMNPGVYDVQLIAIDSTACITADTILLTITVSNPSPVVADFNPVVDCSTLSVETNNLTTGFNLEFLWDMGDLTTATDSTLTHVYATDGSYTITLIATDTACYSSDTISYNIDIPYNVVADMDVDPDSTGCIPFTVDFTNSSTNAVDYLWDFGDGSPTDITFEPSHTFTTAGVFTATLIASDPNSCNLSDTASVVITVGQGNPVVADFTAEQTSNCEELLVVTTDQSLGDNLIWDWDMGDLTTYTDTNVTHNYANTGTYTISLVVTDTVCNLSDSTEVTVILTNGLTMDLGPDIVICPGLTATLDPNITATGFLWNTGDTTQTITVDSAGTYWVDATLGTCIVSDTIDVDQASGYDLGYDLEICLDGVAVLDAGVDAVSYVWSTGDEGRVITVQDSGAYSFTITDAFGCMHTDTINVSTLESSSTVYVPNAFTPNGDGINDVFKAEGLGFEAFELQIFDRWGALIFHGTDINTAWDGTIKGAELVPNGVYVYKLTYNSSCLGNIPVEKFGHVVVVR